MNPNHRYVIALGYVNLFYLETVRCLHGQHQRYHSFQYAYFSIRININEKSILPTPTH